MPERSYTDNLSLLPRLGSTLDEREKKRTEAELIERQLKDVQRKIDSIKNAISQDSIENKEKLLPTQEARLKCREIADRLWNEEKLRIGIKEMADHPEIMAIGGNWSHQTRHRWICGKAPDWASKPGRRTQKTK